MAVSVYGVAEDGDFDGFSAGIGGLDDEAFDSRVFFPVGFLIAKSVG